MVGCVSTRPSARAGWRRVWVRGAMALVAAMAAAVVFAQPAAAAVFVDATLGDVKAEQKVTAAHPQPVQLLFEFRTKGSPNAKATKLLKQDVIDTVKASGLFSDVSEAPAASGAVLNVVIDNVITPEQLHAAEAKGFATGLTLGIAGTTPRDNYVATLDYVGKADAAKITRTAEHGIYVQIGLINKTPPNAVKVDGGLRQGLTVMIRQIVSNPLNAIAQDPGFQGAAAAAPAAPAPDAVPPTPAATPTTPAATTPALS